MTLYDTYKLIRKTRDAFILALREGFGTDEVYTWKADRDLSSISVVNATPLEAVDFPAVVVQAASGQEQRYFGPDYLEEDENQQDVLFASVPITVNIKTYSKSTIDRDELSDLVFEYLKIKNDELATLGVAVVRTTINADTKEFVQDRWFYNGNISVLTYVEWVYTEDESFETVTKVSLTQEVHLGDEEQDVV